MRSRFVGEAGSLDMWDVRRLVHSKVSIRIQRSQPEEDLDDQIESGGSVPKPLPDCFLGLEGRVSSRADLEIP
jgi:hypothetical protein